MHTGQSASVYGRMTYASDQRSAKTGKASAHLVALADWPVCIRAHHPGYVTWEEFVQTRKQLRANWNRDGGSGVAREGTALLQGIVFCGVCGRKMDVQHRAVTEHRSAAYLCQRSYHQDGDSHICQSMISRPVDAAVTQAFLEAVSPMGLEVSLRVLDQIDQDRAAQRRQWELQLEHARYEARLAQRQYDTVDPDNRLVAAELERRWNVKLEQVARLEQAYAQAEHEAQWTITPEERAAMSALAQDLPAVWHAETTTDRERKQLLRFAIEAVELDGRSHPGDIDVQIRWRSGTVTRVRLKRSAPGEGSLKTPEEAVALIRELAPIHSYSAIAARLNAAGYVTAFGRRFTTQHVGYLCRRHGWERGKKHDNHTKM